MKRTGRFWTFVATAIIFWFFANQTQIGWLYIISALLGGVLLAAWVLNFGTLKQVTGQRELDLSADAVPHEGDELAITLRLKNKGQLPASHLSLVEQCAIAPPNSDVYTLKMFIPMLQQQISFTYRTVIDRRGLHHFPPIDIASRAPFGFYERRGTYPIETSLLVYPEVRKLTHLSLLDEQPAAELTHPKAGIGSEVIGVRPYRAGDSPRHIHWRSVARRGQLVSKEFAQETQPGLTIVLDRYCPLTPLPDTKHQPFEMAIKCAVSIAEYAIRQGYPVHLAADQDHFAVPQGALVWDVLMQYTARVTPLDNSHLADVLTYQPMQQFIAVVMAWVDADMIESLLSLQHRGYNILVVLPDPASFPIETQITADAMQAAFERNNIAYRILKHGDDWAEVLSQGLAADFNLSVQSEYGS